MRNGGETDEECRAEDAAMAAKHKHKACRAMQVLAMQAGQEKSMCCVCVGHDCEAEPDSAFDAIGRHIEAVQAGQKPHSAELDYNHMETAAVINSVLFPTEPEQTFSEIVRRIRDGVFYEDYDRDTAALRVLDRTEAELSALRAQVWQLEKDLAEMADAANLTVDEARGRLDLDAAETEIQALRQRAEKAESAYANSDAVRSLCACCAQLRTAESRIAELEAAQAWRPIETAPREERKPILLYYGPGEFAIGAWWGFHEEFHSAGRPWEPQPTHWQPLPAGPEVMQ